MTNLDNSSMVLTASNVKAVFMRCLFEEGDDTSDPAVGEGILRTFRFHKGRIEEHRQDIKDMLDSLPEEFSSAKGGGWSFLNACMDNEGNQWGEQMNAEQLLVLGLASGQASLLMPKEMWHVFPGGVPYFSVNNAAPTLKI